MAEGLEPHHHIIRRAGPTINKHLNLADDQLVSRLISCGCISEKDKGKYSGKSKLARTRFIARFQNQPYKLFLKFVECLRGDPKYIELVTALDEALAEYGYVPPTSVSESIESHETDTIHAPELHISSRVEQELSSMQPTTTDLSSSDAIPIPPKTGTEDATLASTPFNEVPTTPSHIAAEKVPPSDVFQQEAAIVTGDSVTVETISSSDTPTLSSDVTTAVDNVTGATTDSMLKLQRQQAVDEELVAAIPTVNRQPSEDIDNITTSLNGLSIAIKDGDFPRLPFEGDRETMTFTSEGGELFSFVHKFRIVVPPNAVPTGSYATLHVIGYSHGPFQLPNGCKPCSDFIFVEMEGIDSFQLPAEVEISHNLIMESYTKCHDVSICRCEYDSSFITVDPSHQYPVVFKKITEPEVSNNDNVFSFKLKTFCGLCATYDLCPSHKFPYLKDKSKSDSSDNHPLHHIQSGEHPLHHSQSGEHPLHHGQSGEHPLHHSQSGEHPFHHSHSGEHPFHHSQSGEHPLHHGQSGEHPLHHSQSGEHPFHHSHSGEHPFHHSQSWEHPLHHGQSGEHPLHHSQSGEHPFHHSHSGEHPFHHSQSGEHPLHHGQSGEHPLHHSQSGEHPFHHSHSGEHPFHHSQSGEHPLHHGQSGEHPLHHSQSGEHPFHHSHSGEHPFHHSQSWEHPFHHSQSEGHPFHHGQSGEHSLHYNYRDSTDNRIPSFNSQSSCGSVECKDSPGHGNSRKRKMEGSYSAGSQEKQICRLEYLLLCYWPVPYKDDELSAMIFVCRNCPTSIAACKNQVTTLSGFKTDPSKSIAKYLEFRFDESRRITVDAEVTTADATGWDVHSSSNEIHENDVERLYDQSESLKHLVREFQYPPRVTYYVSYNEKTVTSEMVKFTLHCSGIQDTLCSKDCDKRINLRAKSRWFGNNQLTGTSSWSMSSVDFDFSPHVITTRLLVEVAMKMNKFELVARHLGFEENQIIRIQDDYHTCHERCYQMLREWWQNSPTQSPATLEELHRAMCCTDQGNCLPRILERNIKYEDIEWLSKATDISEKSLRYTVKDSTAMNTLLSDVATKLAATWRQVGRAIGVDDCELDEIQCDYQKVIERAYQMLRRWREKYGSSASVSQLAIALLIVGQSKIISLILKSYREKNVYIFL